MDIWGVLDWASRLLICAGAVGAAYVLWERPTKRWDLWLAIMVAGGCWLLLKWLRLCLLLHWGSEMLLRREGEMPPQGEMSPQGVASALIACADMVLALCVCLLGIRYLWQCLRGRRERSLWRMLPVGFFTLLSLPVVLNILAGIAALGAL